MKLIVKILNRFFFNVIVKSLFIGLSLTLFLSCEDNFNPVRNQSSFVFNSLRRSDTCSIKFFILSDWGFSGNTGQREVAAEMSKISKRVGLKFILTCGDNFQIAGVKNINDSLWQTNYENVYNDNALLVPWYPALGNHDYLGNPDAEVAYSSSSKYWSMPARYYSFVKRIDARTSARFIVLDTKGLIQEYNSISDTTAYDSIPQYKWIKELLSQSKEKWIFVTGHHPVFSASTIHGDTYEMKKLIKPLFDKYHVDFYICGHDHHFEHAKIITEYTDYIVTGTGGNPRPVGKNEHTIFSMSSLGFTYIELTPNKSNLYFISAYGEIGYNYVKSK